MATTHSRENFRSKGSKITTPIPFNMMLRNVNMDAPKLTGNSAQLKDELECLKKFRANMVPASTFLPLYEDMVKVETAKRQTRNRIRQQDIVAKQQPFRFLTPNDPEAQRNSSLARDHTGRRRSKSTSDVGRNVNVRATGVLTAPVKSYADFTAENELLREIRIKARAEKLLKQSALPTSIRDHQDRVLLKRELLRAKLAAEEHHVRISPAVPLKAVHSPATSTITTATTLPKSTSPFVMRVNSPAPLRPRSISSMATKLDQNEEEEFADNFPLVTRRRGRRSHSWTDLRDTAFLFAPRLNETTRRRNEDINRKRNLRDENSNFKQKHNDVWQLKEAVLKNIGQNHGSPQKEKLSNLRYLDEVRRKEYKEEIKEMVGRVKSQPLLIQRQSKINAKNQVEKKFQQSLEKHGLDLNFVLANSVKGKKEQTPSTSKENSEDGETSENDDENENGTNSESQDNESDFETDSSTTENEETSGDTEEEPERVPEHDCD